MNKLNTSDTCRYCGGTLRLIGLKYFCSYCKKEDKWGFKHEEWYKMTYKDLLHTIETNEKYLRKGNNHLRKAEEAYKTHNDIEFFNHMSIYYNTRKYITRREYNDQLQEPSSEMMTHYNNILIEYNNNHDFYNEHEE